MHLHCMCLVPASSQGRFRVSRKVDTPRYGILHLEEDTHLKFLSTAHECGYYAHRTSNLDENHHVELRGERSAAIQQPSSLINQIEFGQRCRSLL